MKVQDYMWICPRALVFFFFFNFFFINSFDEFNLVLNSVGWTDNPTQFDLKNLKLRCGWRLKFNRLDFGQLKNPKKLMHTQVICDINFWFDLIWYEFRLLFSNLINPKFNRIDPNRVYPTHLWISLDGFWNLILFI